MLGRTHLLTGVFLSILFFSFYSFGILIDISMLVMFILGALFPDVDSSSSLLGRKVKIIGFLSKHRGFFHSPFGLIFFGVIVYVVHPYLGFAFSAGYASHLLLDALTKEGIHFLGIRIKGPFKVGSMLEHGLYIILAIASLVILF